MIRQSASSGDPGDPDPGHVRPRSGGRMNARNLLPVSLPDAGAASLPRGTSEAPDTPETPGRTPDPE